VPYAGEYASYGPLRRIVESERVKDLLARSRVGQEDHEDTTGILSLKADVTADDWRPDFVLAIDGSHIEEKVEIGYPGAEVSYITVAAILLDMSKVKSLDQVRPFDPREFRKTETAATIDCAMPGCNVVLEDEPSARASLRRCLFELFEQTKADEEGESLLQTYEALLALKPVEHDQKCPYWQECDQPGCAYVRGKGKYNTTCDKARPLYSTDALRIHEGMGLGGSNGAMFAEIMQVLERLWIVHLLRMVERNRWLSTLSRMAIVLDGPLAVFGHPAWLAPAIRQELARLDVLTAEATGSEGLFIVGIEKSGEFVGHLRELDRVSWYEDDLGVKAGRLDPGTAFLLTDDYIKRHVVLSAGRKPYGQDTYFARKFYYKASSGALLVATLPAYTDAQRDMSRADVDQFPRLASAITLLEEMASTRYTNALMPLVQAHAEAAIPLRLGDKVLKELASKLMPREEV
jgi:hypothetical protein